MKKIVNLLALLLPALLLTGACTKDNFDTNFTVTEQELQIPGEGGQCCINYTLAYPKIDGKIEIDNPVEWIQDLDLTKPGKILFNAESNYNAEDRSAALTISYSGSGQSYVVNLSQTTGTFGITISDIQEDNAMVTVIPKDKEMTYILMTVKKAYYDELGSDEKLYEKVLKLYQEYAQMYNMPLGDFLKQAAFKTGDYKSQITDLSIDTEYYFFAVGMNEKGEQTSELVKSYFKTKEIQKITMSFEFETQIKGPDVKISVTPSIENQLYFFNPVRKSELEDSGKSISEYAEEYIAGQIYLGTFMGASAEDVIKSIASKGKDSFETCLKTECDYLVYAFALTSTGIIISDIQTEEFRTGKVLPSENILTISTETIGVDHVEYNIQSTNKDPYVQVLMETEKIINMSDTEIIDMIALEYTMDNIVTSGNNEIRAARLRPDTDYSILAFGYYAENATTGLFRKEFRTEQSENPENLQFTLNISDVASKSASLTITAEPKTALYLCNICAADASEEEIKAGLESEIKYYIDMGHAEDRAEYMRIYGHRGDYSNVLGDLTPETSYKVYAIGVYDQDGSFATDMVFSETFTTMEQLTADIDIQVNHGPYYDGTELGKLDNEYADADGVAVMPAQVSIDGEAKNFYYHIFNDDLTDGEAYPDQVIIDNLLKAGIKNEKEMIFYCTFNKDLTILAVAEDENGNFSKVYREKIHLTPEGCTPAENFFKKTQAPAIRAVLQVNL